MTSLFCVPGFLGQSLDWTNHPISERFRTHSLNLFSSKTSNLRSSLVGFNSEEMNSINLSVDQTTPPLDFDSIPKLINTIGASLPKKRVLVGYSLGGRLALSSLFDHSTVSPWDAAVIISAHPGLFDETEKKTRIQSDQMWAERFLKMPWSEVIALWNQQSVLQGKTEMPKRESDFSRTRLAEALTTLSLGRQKNFRPALQNCKIPILWITGENDQKFKKLGEEVSNLQPTIEYHVLKNAGHRAPWDCPTEFTHLVADFISRKIG